MDHYKRHRRQTKRLKTTLDQYEEVSSIEWEFINMTEQEEDLIYRMYKLVGDSEQQPLDVDAANGSCFFTVTASSAVASQQ